MTESEMYLGGYLSFNIESYCSVFSQGLTVFVQFSFFKAR